MQLRKNNIYRKFTLMKKIKTKFLIKYFKFHQESIKDKQMKTWLKNQNLGLNILLKVWCSKQVQEMAHWRWNSDQNRKPSLVRSLIEYYSKWFLISLEYHKIHKRMQRYSIIMEKNLFKILTLHFQELSIKIKNFLAKLSQLWMIT